MVDDPAVQHPALTAILTPLAGLAAIKVDNVRQSSLASQKLRLYWFRVEEPRQVTWAGNPDKPRAENTKVPTLAPRHSFERWVEVKSNTCRPWNNQDRLHCAHLRNALLRAIRWRGADFQCFVLAKKRMEHWVKALPVERGWRQSGRF